VLEFFRENDGCRDNWTGQSASPGFINAGDGGKPKCAKLALMPKTAAPIHRRGKYWKAEKLKR